MANEYGNYCTLNPIDKDSHTVTYSNGNKTALWGANGWGESRGTFSIPKSATGKFYVEFKMDVNGGTNLSVGIKGSDEPVAGITGIAWRTNGTVYDGNGGTSTETTYTTNDIIGLEFDMDNDVVKGYKNSASVVDWTLTDKMAGGNEMEGTNIVVRVRNYATGEKVTMRTDPVDWEYQPSGTIPWNTANLPTPAPINYEDEYYIQAGISHSNGSTTAVTLPKTVSGGAMVRIKRTNTTGSWYVFDTVRGANKFQFWDTQAAEDTSTFDDQNLTGTTFTIPSDMASGTYLLECFYMGSYFQIKAFTGTGSAHAENYSGTLDTAPGMFWNVKRDSAGESPIFHESVGNTKGLLSSTTAVPITVEVWWNNTSPTTTQFTVGASATVNNNTSPYIHYAWANSGPYRFGFYLGTGNADGPLISMNGSPSTYVVRRIDAANSWYLGNSEVETEANPLQEQLILNTTAAIYADTAGWLDRLATGVKSRTTGSFSNNGSGTYIYGAFGIQPLTDGAVNQGKADGRVPPYDQAYGGNTIKRVGNFWVHTFTSSGTFTPHKAMDVEYLVVAGGGGAGSNRGGGGGGGGYLTATGFSVSAQAYAITVGAGGAGGPANSAEKDGSKGSNSVFSSITSTGGGFGAGRTTNTGGGSGGSGGGSGSGESSTSTTAGAASPSGQGNAGGSGVGSSSSPGGGGAGEVGFSAVGTAAGEGGDGLASSITGTSTYYSGGGGGSSDESNGGKSGGLGGGGAGGHGGQAATAGTANTGGGGGTSGGKGSPYLAGGAGGSGVVIIKYAIG